jgi:hypothetical protein
MFALGDAPKKNFTSATMTKIMKPQNKSMCTAPMTIHQP